MIIDYSHLGRNIREQRLRLGLTLRQIAAENHVKVQHISHIERGTGRPSLETLVLLSIALDVPIDDLLDGCLVVL